MSWCYFLTKYVSWKGTIWWFLWWVWCWFWRNQQPIIPINCASCHLYFHCSIWIRRQLFIPIFIQRPYCCCWFVYGFWQCCIEATSKTLFSSFVPVFSDSFSADFKIPGTCYPDIFHYLLLLFLMQVSSPLEDIYPSPPVCIYSLRE